MSRFLSFHLSPKGCKESGFFLSFSWFAGLISGILLSFLCSNDTLKTFILAASEQPVTIHLLSVLLLPLLFSAAAVYTRNLWFLFLIAFLKAFLFSFTAASVSSLSSSGGWLIQMLLMFSDSLMLPVFWWYWHACLQQYGRPFMSRTAAVIFIASLICITDCFAIAPFLGNLL